jgi:Arc/MetJ family transcription regulator
MRISITVDDELLAAARELSGVTEMEALLSLALTSLVEHQSARRLARLGGSEPNLEDIPRRRDETP